MKIKTRQIGFIEIENIKRDVDFGIADIVVKNEIVILPRDLSPKKIYFYDNGLHVFEIEFVEDGEQ